MRRATLALLWMVVGLSGQEGPKLFQLWLPDVSPEPFAAGRTVIEIPDTPLQKLQILVREVEQRGFRPSGYKVFINGKGVGNVLEEQRNLEGTLLIMNPENLRKRPDEIFDRTENAIEFLAVGANGRRYYQNWVVRVADQNRNRFFTYTGTISPNYPKDVPPDIVLEEPTLPVRLASGEKSRKVTIRGSYSGGSSLSVNGASAGQAAEGAVGKFTQEIVVGPAMREIVVEAKSTRGHTRRVQIPVYAPVAPTARLAMPGGRYAVVIGISRFTASKDSPSNIEGAAAEATAIGEALRTKLGFAAENVRILTDEQATLAQMRVALSDFVSKAGPNDLLLVFLTTHGFHDPRPGKSDSVYLATYETQLAALETTALSVGDLDRLLSRSTASNQVAMVFNVMHPMTEAWRIPGSNLVGNHLLGILGGQVGRAVMVTSSGGDSGKSIGKPSLVSQWLVEGAGGAADLNGDRVISMKEMMEFVGEKMRVDGQGGLSPRYRGDGKVLEVVVGEALRR